MNELFFDLRRKLARGALLLAIPASMQVALGQAVAVDLAQTPPQRGSGRLLRDVGMPPSIAVLRKAMAATFDQTGHERRVLQGTVTFNGATVPFTFTREMDQGVRLDVGEEIARRTLLVTSIPQTPKSSQTSSSAEDQFDHDLLETLASDSPEGLFYLYGTASQTFWLGEHFSTQDASGSYSAPFYDIAASVENSPYQRDNPHRVKRFFFDSATKLLGLVTYADSSSKTSLVEVVYSGWNVSSGQACPGSISRAEQGRTVFTITVTSCSSVATALDNLFSLGK